METQESGYSPRLTQEDIQTVFVYEEIVHALGSRQTEVFSIDLVPGIPSQDIDGLENLAGMDPLEALRMSNEMLQQATEEKNEIKQAHISRIIGFLYFQLGKLDPAQEFLDRAGEIFVSKKDGLGLARVYMHKASLAKKRPENKNDTEYEESFYYNAKALSVLSNLFLGNKLEDEEQEKNLHKVLLLILTNVAALYTSKKNLNMTQQIAENNIQLARLFGEEEYAQKSIFQNKSRIGVAQYHQGNFEAAKALFEQAHEGFEKLGDVSSTLSNKSNVGVCLRELGLYIEALALQEEVEIEIQKTRQLDNRKENMEELSIIHQYLVGVKQEKLLEKKENLNIDEALELRDDIAGHEIKFAKYQQGLKDTEELIQQENIKKEEAFESIKKLQEKNEELQLANKKQEETNKQLARQNTDITDSINYTKRMLEGTILGEIPMRKIFGGIDDKGEFEDNVIYYHKSKDILSGDFPFAMELELEDGKKLKVVGVFDCTGHGVPGGMLSGLGTNFLKKAIVENKGDPARTLDDVRDAFIQHFAGHQDEASQNVKDCMVGTLMVLDEEEGLMYFASSYDSPYLFREGEIQEIKADRMSIGGEIREGDGPFTLHKMSYQKGDVFFMSSDGYPDQFGGENGKKLKKRKFQEYLVEAGEMSPMDAELFLEFQFDNWKKYHNQIDDVTVVGIRL